MNDGPGLWPTKKESHCTQTISHFVQVPEEMRSPVQFLERVSGALGLPVWIKREDLLTHSSLGGSKARKLRAILASARAKAATDLVTTGTTGSHHVHAACVLGAEAGLCVHAVLLPQPDLPYANAVYKKTRSTGAELLYAAGPGQAMLRLAGLMASLRRRGKRPCLVLPGGTGVDGVSAYRDAGLELAHDLEAMGQKGVLPDFQVCVYGTGGIAAGLYAAGRMVCLPSLLAVQVYPGLWNGKCYIRTLAALARKPAVLPAKSDPVFTKQAASLFTRKFSGLETPDSYIEDGYGTESIHCREAVKLFEQDGIFLDPVYMARAGQALIDLSRRRPGPGGLLLWYTSPGRL